MSAGKVWQKCQRVWELKRETISVLGLPENTDTFPELNDSLALWFSFYWGHTDTHERAEREATREEAVGMKRTQTAEPSELS